ncbi:family 43 glycosylhydrolase [Termitidicoccus mucosus]
MTTLARLLLSALLVPLAPTVLASPVDPPPQAVVFVGGPDMTATAGELAAAFKQLARSGGVIVLRGPVRINGNFDAPAHDAPVTVTSSHDGRDYRREGGAKLELGAVYTVNGPTTFASLVIAPDDKAGRIYCNGRKVVFGKGVSCQPSGGKFPTIVGATRNAGGRADSDVTINSGQWDTVVGGAFQDAAPTSGTLRVTVNGGRFYGAVCAAGTGRHTGDAEMTLNQGFFHGGVAGLGNHPAASVRGAIRVTINGGTFYNTIAASRHAGAELAGSYALAFNGGDFTSVTGVTGTRGLRGSAASSLMAARAALLDAENIGELTFTNPLITGADPWVFFHDGFYYCTATDGSQLSGRKVANLSDLPYAPPVTYWKPAPGRDYSKNLWSPKIYHFSAEEAGEKNAGWYLYLTANDGLDSAAADHRMYVLRALTDDPFGPYGSPEDGKPDVPARMADTKRKNFRNEWVAGPKVLKYGGKLYFIWVSRVGDKNSARTGDHWQFLYIDELVNPWTIAGRPAMICRPTLDWEKRGAGPSSDGKRMLPEVVEGGTSVYAADGSLYLLYAASGYWTPHYAIGLMKLIGSDPMTPAHWQKATQPVFKASDEVVGTGNACYVPSPTGKSNWAIYHAYVGKKTRGVPRQLFAEPYVANDKDVAIGIGRPLPLGTPLKIEANPMPLRKKISGFTDALPPPGPEEPLALGNYDARKITVNGNASVEKQAGALIVTIPAEQKATWPGINLRPQNSSPYFDISRCSVLAMDVKNLTAAQIGVKCELNNPGATGNMFCERGGIALDAGETATLRVRYQRDGLVPDDVTMEGVKNTPECLKGRRNLDPKRIVNIMLFIQPLGCEVKFAVSNIRLEEPFAGVSDAVKSAETFYPAFDRYGQYKHKDWSGKTRSDADLVKARADEDADLAAHPRPAEFDRYGGWAGGPQLEATGAFRTAKHDDKWWLVDPEGRLFFSHGIDQFHDAELTGVTLREHYFEGLPSKGSPGAEGLWRKQAWLSGTPNFYRDKKVTPDAFDFLGANLLKKYGPDHAAAYRERLCARAGSWGVNTLGNWTKKDYLREGRFPYVGQADVPGAVIIQGHAGSAARKFQDVFDDGFEDAIVASLQKNWAFAANDPMCIGFFVDNEHAWDGPTSLAEAVLRSPASQPAKREFRRRLEKDYGSITALNAAWKTSHASFDAFLSSTELPDREAALADLLAFNTALSDRYFESARNAVRRFAPGRLYLGCRFQTIPPASIMKSAAKFCDVVSLNLYEYSIESLRLPDDVDRPMLIGEFHFGTIANGHFHPGVQGCASDAERGRAYQRYMEGALRNPLVVGTHYYRLVDQCPAGRSLDDENFQHGFLDICDRPYPEMVAAARSIAARMYALRSAAGAPQRQQ